MQWKKTSSYVDKEEQEECGSHKTQNDDPDQEAAFLVFLFRGRCDPLLSAPWALQP